MARSNEVRINVVADTAQAETSIKRVGQRFERGTPQVKGFQNAFTGLQKTMGLFGIGAIGVGVAVRGVAGAMGEAAKAQGNLNLQLGRLDPGTRKTFDEISESFGELSKQFAVSTDDIALALATYLAITKDSTTATEDLNLILALTSVGEITAEEATRKVIAARQHSIAVIRELTGDTGDLSTAIDDYVKAAGLAVTATDRFGVEIQNLKDDLAKAINRFFEIREAMNQWIELNANVSNADVFAWIGKQTSAALDHVQRLIDKLKELAGVGGGGGGTGPRIGSFPVLPGEGSPSGGGGRFGNFGLGRPDASQEGGSVIGPGRSIGPGLGNFRDPIRPATAIPVPAGPNPESIFDQFRQTFRGITSFGHGGIARQPTLAVVGDNGPEAMVPLSGPGGGFGGTTIINIQGDAIVDDDARMGALADEITRRIDIINRRGVR